VKRKSGKDKIRYKSQIAYSYYEDEGVSKAENEYQKILSSDIEDEERAEVFSSMALMYSNEGQEFKEAILLDKVNELKGENDKRFDIGLAYSGEGLHGLAMATYDDLESHDESSALYNNLGVEYSNLGLDFKSVDKYKKAIDLDSTLASGNLAEILLDFGFEEEAKKVLNDAIEKENTDSKVYSVMSSIEQRRESESNKKEKYKKSAERLREFLRDYCSYRFNPTDISSIEVNTSLEDKIMNVSSEVTEKSLIIEWQKESKYGSNKKWRLKGEMEKSTSRVEIEKETNTNALVKSLNKISNQDHEDSFTSVGRGFLIAESQSDVRVMWGRGNLADNLNEITFTLEE
jgi:tetratricopeptide (TPR) repeat protein